MKKVKLGDVCDVFAGQGAPQGNEKYCNYDSGIPFIKAGDLGDLMSGKSERELQCVDEAVAKECKLKLYQAGSVLFAKSGMSCMKGYVYCTKEPCYVVSHLAIITPKKVEKEYLKHYFQYYKPNTLVKDSAYPSISLSDIANMEILLPGNEEQKEIADRLDKVVALIEKRKDQLAKLDQLVKSQFIEMFGGVHDSKIYPYKAVKELTDVVSGGTPSRDISEYWEEGTIPWVKTTELQNNIVTEVEEYITEQGLSNSSAKIVPSGTVLIAMYGQGKTRGMTAYLGIEACTNQACACILPSAKINQTFLWQFFILSYDNLRDMAKGGNQPNLNGNMIKNYPILCPPRELQEQFASFVEQIDKSKFEIQQSIDKLETLKRSLMQQYFG